MSTILRLRDVEARIGFKKTFIYDAISKGEFPAPEKMGGHSSYWFSADIDAYIDDLQNKHRPSYLKARIISLQIELDGLSATEAK